MQTLFQTAQAHWRVVLFFILLAVLANAPILSGLVDCNPGGYYNGLGLSSLPARNVCFLDSSVALYTQALGHLSARDWLHLTIPWWNPYLGVGMPLAAEIQDEAFFLPVVLLLHFQSGWFWQRLLFQIGAGLFTYIFLRQNHLTRTAALFGGALFELNGTFYLNPGMVAAPVCFLPLLLVGLERARGAAAQGASRGWSLVTLSLAGSIYAGFPETAFFDGLLGLSWACMLALRAAPPVLRRFVAKVLISGAIGLTLTLPMVVPFAEFLQYGDVSLHSGFFAHLAYPRAAAPLQMFPLFYGAFSEYAPASLYGQFGLLWGLIGGWFGVAPVILAIAALCGAARPRCAARWLLAGWAVLWEARCFGFPPVTFLVNLIPGVAASNASRYAVLSAEFSVFALAAFGVDDMMRGLRLQSGRFRAALLLSLACGLACLLPALGLAAVWFRAVPSPLLWISLFSLACTLLCALLVLRALRTGRHRRLALGVVLAGGVALFWAPQLGTVRHIAQDRTGLAYLQSHIRLSRYFSLGPLGPNFPPQYGIASPNAFQLPSPTNWDQYYQRQLLGRAPDPFYGVDVTPQMLAAIVPAQLGAFEAIGTKYIGVWPSMDPLAKLAAAAPVPVLTSPALPAGPSHYATLRAGMALQGAWPTPANLPGTKIYAVRLTLGTFNGRADGPLRLHFCTTGPCADADFDLTLADDNAVQTIVLDHPLPVSPGSAVSYDIQHPAGAPIAIAAQSVSGRDVPQVQFQLSPPSSAPVEVASGPAMILYRLPGAEPYASASLPGCDLVIESRQDFTTDCPAPAHLLRRELFYPGWRAQVNGAPQKIQPAGSIFQSIALPAGKARIHFSYLPRHSWLSIALALLALGLWLALALPGTRRGGWL